MKAKLERIATDTRRIKSFLAGEAVAAYAHPELETIRGINTGLADLEAGRLVTHDQAMAEIYAAIDADGPSPKA